VVLAETLEHLLRKLDDCGRQIVSLRLQGFTTPEISAQVGRTERTVQRVLDQVKQWLQRRHLRDEES
jgi:hypothetical protein